jgi:hypothetical protein
MRSCVSNLDDDLSFSPRAPLPRFICATRLRFTRILVDYILESSFFDSKSI